VEAIGSRRWVIADGFIPDKSNGPEPEMTSHETAAMLNTGDVPANISITCYFADREPTGPYTFVLEPRRTRHIRFNDLDTPERVPRSTEYAALIESDLPIVVQHTRLDSRQAENTIFSTIAFQST
jgi:hypothetical protein